MVLSGEGPSFCSGLDFPSFMQDGLDISEELFVHRDGDAANVAQRITYDWQRLPVPVIAALHGNCIGGGAQLALGPDIRIAAPDVRISILEIKYGLIPDMGFSQTLPHLVGLDVAKELIFTGRIVEAPRRSSIGLVTRLADDPAGCSARARRGDREALTGRDQARKRLLNEAVWASRRGIAGARGGNCSANCWARPNQIAAVQAALAKQPAEFTDPEDPNPGSPNRGTVARSRRRPDPLRRTIRVCPRAALTLFHVRGIRIGVDYSWFLVLFLVIIVAVRASTSHPWARLERRAPYVLAVVSALAFFASILLHELGHAVVAMRNGIAITDITLWLFGGVARMSRDTDSAGVEFRVAAAGPLVTLLIAIACTVVGVALARLRAGFPRRDGRRQRRRGLRAARGRRLARQHQRRSSSSST